MSDPNGRDAQSASKMQLPRFRRLRRACRHLWELYRNCLEANVLLRPWMSRKVPSQPPLNGSFAQRLVAGLSEERSNPKSGVGPVLAATVSTLVVASYCFTVDFGAGAQAHVIRTGANEITTASLSDGSTVSLSARSTLSVDETGPYRVAHIETGEVTFKIRATLQRPFVVETIGATATAIENAELRVAIGRSIEIMVYDGTVKVTPRGAKGQGPSRWLHKGQSWAVPVDSPQLALSGLLGGAALHECSNAALL